MTSEDLHRMAEAHPDAMVFDFPGPCADCGAEIRPEIRLTPEGFEVSGGAVFHVPDTAFEPGNFRVKCEACHEKSPLFRGWQNCEVYSRVVGYYRPVQNWNDAKRHEFEGRRDFRLDSVK